jgi:hypothetical protein
MQNLPEIVFIVSLLLPALVVVIGAFALVLTPGRTVPTASAAPLEPVAVH